MSFVNRKKTTKCFAGDFINNQWPSAQVHGLFKHLREHAKILFLIKVQITREWDHLHELSFMNSVVTSLGQQMKYFILIQSKQK